MFDAAPFQHMRTGGVHVIGPSGGPALGRICYREGGVRESEVDYWVRRSEASMAMAQRATDPKVARIHRELSELQIVAALMVVFNPSRGEE